MQRYLLNPPAKLMVWAGLLPGLRVLRGRHWRRGRAKVVETTIRKPDWRRSVDAATQPPSHAAAVRRLGTELATVRVDFVDLDDRS